MCGFLNFSQSECIISPDNRVEFLISKNAKFVNCFVMNSHLTFGFNDSRKKDFLNDFVCRNQIKLGTLKPLNEEKCEDTKAVIRSRKNRRTDNIMTKSVKILKG